jgi:hypothetical protein
MEQMAVAGATAELQIALGAPLEAADGDVRAEASLLEQIIANRKTEPLRQQTTALAAAQFLREYASSVALDVAAVRSAITYKLMELANCGDPKHELKALEMLGKHSDVGLFTERSEITVNYKNPESLEEAIKERVKRILNAEIIDVTPLHLTLDEELGSGHINKPKEISADELVAELGD